MLLNRKTRHRLHRSVSGLPILRVNPPADESHAESVVTMTVRVMTVALGHRDNVRRTFFSTRRKAIDAWWHGWVGSHRPRFRCSPRRSSEEASIQTRYRRPSRDPQVPEKHGPAFAQASVCTRRMQYLSSSPRMAPTYSLGRCARLRWT